MSMHTRHKLLILANDAGLRDELAPIFSDLEVTSEPISEQSLHLIRRLEPEVVLLDVRDAGDLALLPQILNIAPVTRIVAMLAQGARDLAVQAVGFGADDFYYMPIDARVLSLVVRRALRMRELEDENAQLREQTG